jgi:S-formylglutathione hydrolase
VLYFLSGLTCSEDNAAQKSGFAEYAKKHGVAVVFPDTSPRKLGFAEVNDNENWKVGYGAGHYCDATQEPWSNNFNMYTYVTSELPNIVNSYFPVDPATKSIMGHSMGGLGALTVGLRNTSDYASVSAFAPIGNPETSGFCTDAMSQYLGKEQAS